MSIKVKTLIGKEIKHYNISNHSNILDRIQIMIDIDKVFFNEKNKDINKDKIFNYLKTAVSEKQSDIARAKIDVLNAFNLRNCYFLDNDGSLLFSNILYNLESSVAMTWLNNLDLIMNALPNFSIDDASALIIEKVNVEAFIIELEKNKELLNLKEGVLELINDYHKGLVNEDLIISRDFYLPDDFDLSNAFGSKTKILMSDNFKNFLSEKELEEEDYFSDFSVEEIYEHYILEKEIVKDYVYLFNQCKNFIKNNSEGRVYLDIEECKDLNFIHVDMTKTLII